MKIAVLILAHKNPGQLKKLVDALKSDFEIFIHFDKRCPIPDSIRKEKNIHLSKKRFPAYWGSYNTQLAVLELLRMAYAGNCDHYILISGQDLPLRSNSEIKAFISSSNKDHIYHFPLPRKEWGGSGGMERMSLFWDTKYESGNKMLGPLLLPLKASFYFLRSFQKLSGLRRKIPFAVYCGSLWMNLTKEAVSYILQFVDKNKWYIDHYKYTRCTDEIFFHTILLSFDYENKDHIINDDLRYIDWESGPQYPRTLTMSDYGRCIASKKIFGRKFDEDKDNDIIDKVLEMRK